MGHEMSENIETKGNDPIRDRLIATAKSTLALPAPGSNTYDVNYTCLRLENALCDYEASSARWPREELREVWRNLLEEIGAVLKAKGYIT